MSLFFSNFILLGDFNIDYFCTQNSLLSKLSCVTSSLNLSQIVTEPTRISGHTCTPINLVFVSSPSQIVSCETIPALANSDHYGVQIIHSINSSKRQNKIPPRRIWRYADADFVEIADLLDEVDWDSLMVGDVDSCWTAWKRCFLDVKNRCIRQRVIKSIKSLPWISKAVIQAMRKRKALFQTAKVTGNSSDMERCKKQRNRVLSMLRVNK